MISAEEAARLGIFNRVVPTAQLLDVTGEIAAALAAKPPLAVALARRAVYDSFNMTLQDVLSLEVENQVRCFESADAREGIRAFLEKRRAVFGRSPADDAEQ
jgi:enoyl-CoA hydratase/carnithine racemase